MALVFGGMSFLPNLVSSSVPYTVDAAIRSMFSSLNSFTMLAVPLFMLSGVIMSIALLLRILIEMVKLPNMQIEQNWLLYMGQWLSIPMAIWAIWLVFYSIEQGKSDELKPHIFVSRADKRRLKKKKKKKSDIY